MVKTQMQVGDVMQVLDIDWWVVIKDLLLTISITGVQKESLPLLESSQLPWTDPGAILLYRLITLMTLLIVRSFALKIIIAMRLQL